MNPVGAGIGRRRRGFADINVTPLVDVMLVLVVVFMVTAPLLSSSLPVELPSVGAASLTEEEARLVVTITAEEGVFLDDVEVTESIEAVLLADPRIRSGQPLFIRADREARYGVVARVVAAGQGAGARVLNLLVEPGPPALAER